VRHVLTKADTVICCLSLPASLRLRRILACASRPGSNALDLDVNSAVLGKLQTNEHRYPADEFRGRFRRPERQKSGVRQIPLGTALFDDLLTVW
jgi:hypothetical protein